MYLVLVQESIDAVYVPLDCAGIRAGLADGEARYFRVRNVKARKDELSASIRAAAIEIPGVRHDG
jgi:hypothetical protein